MKSNKLCECGCGEFTTIMPKNNTKHGYVKGQPHRFVRGHGCILDPVVHFWKQVDKASGPISPITGTRCWLWTGTIVNDKYGQVWFADKRRQAHRVAWFLTHGEWPKHNACHHCDNPPCVNPEHLFDGDTQANSDDMVVKNRSAKGENNGASKLTKEQVLAIRMKSAAGHTLQVLADEYGVSYGLISHIKLGKIWRHLG